MNFQFDSLQAFLQMGGHGPYIWMCYLFVLVVWGYLALAPTLQTKAFFKEERRRQERREALQEEGK